MLDPLLKSINLCLENEKLAVPDLSEEDSWAKRGNIATECSYHYIRDDGGRRSDWNHQESVLTEIQDDDKAHNDFPKETTEEMPCEAVPPGLETITDEDDISETLNESHAKVSPLDEAGGENHATKQQSLAQEERDSTESIQRAGSPAKDGQTEAFVPAQIAPQTHLRETHVHGEENLTTISVNIDEAFQVIRHHDQENVELIKSLESFSDRMDAVDEERLDDAIKSEPIKDHQSPANSGNECRSPLYDLKLGL